MLRVNVADTPSKQERGLMFVKDLPHDHGMVFKFPQPKKLSFWGVNTYIPLDIAFVDTKNRIVDIQEIHPLSQKSVACKEDCVIAVEANIDYFKDNNISIGDTISIVDDIMEGPCVKFSKVNKFAQKSRTEEISIEEAEGIDLEDNDFLIDQYEEEPYLDGDFEDRDGYEDFQEVSDESDFSEQELPQLGESDIEFADDIEDDLEDFDPNEFVSVDKDGDFPEEADGDFPDFTNAMDALVWGDSNNQTVWIDYETKSGKNIQRNIEPHGIYMASTGNLIVVTFDETINDIRAFIVNEIKDFQFLGRTFKDKFVFTPN